MSSEGAKAPESRDVTAVQVVASCSVELKAGAKTGPVVAEVGVASSARWAMTAGGNEAHYYMVTSLDPGHSRPHCLHDASAFVTADDRVRDIGAPIPCDQMLIRVAHARGSELDEDLTLSGWIEFDSLQ
jgi:hypothetical protein